MKTVKKSSKYLYFVQDDINTIKENILTISPKNIDALLNKIATHGSLEKLILAELLAVIQEKVDYYRQKQNQSYNQAPLKSAIIFMILLGLLLCGLYLWYNNNLAQHDQLKMLIDELKPYGINVKECSKRYYKYTEYWLEITPTRDLFDYQWNTAKKIIEQLYKLHSTIHGKFKWIFIIIASGAIYTVTEIFSCIRQWLRPQYNKRYEKYAMIEDKIQQKIAKLSLKYKSK